MATIDATTARCVVLTFKEGALSAIGHDLELEVTRLSIDVADDRSIDARFDTRSLRVLHALRDGRPTDALSADDRRKIERTIVEDVLEAERFPEARFRAPPPAPSGDGYAIAGTLALHGVERPLAVTTRALEGRQVAELTLHQPDFGIRPYRAMLGALRVRADVRVRVSVPWPR